MTAGVEVVEGFIGRGTSHDVCRVEVPRVRPVHGEPWRAGQVLVRNKGPAVMLWSITVVLLILWLLGFTTFHMLGGWIHLVLVLVVISIAFNIIRGRRVL